MNPKTLFWIDVVLFIIGNTLLVAFWWKVSLGGIPAFLIITVAWILILIEHYQIAFKHKE
jgi:hypothetical protein